MITAQDKLAHKANIQLLNIMKDIELAKGIGNIADYKSFGKQIANQINEITQTFWLMDIFSKKDIVRKIRTIEGMTAYQFKGDHNSVEPQKDLMHTGAVVKETGKHNKTIGQVLNGSVIFDDKKHPNVVLSGSHNFGFNGSPKFFNYRITRKTKNGSFSNNYEPFSTSVSSIIYDNTHQIALVVGSFPDYSRFKMADIPNVIATYSNVIGEESVVIIGAKSPYKLQETLEVPFNKLSIKDNLITKAKYENPRQQVQSIVNAWVSDEANKLF